MTTYTFSYWYEREHPVIRYRTKWVFWQEAYIAYQPTFERVSIEVNEQMGKAIIDNYEEVLKLIPDTAVFVRLEGSAQLTTYIPTYGGSKQ